MGGGRRWSGFELIVPNKQFIVSYLFLEIKVITYYLSSEVFPVGEVGGGRAVLIFGLYVPFIC